VQKAGAHPAVFKADQSLEYILEQEAATAAYDNPAMALIQRDLVNEGIAEKLSGRVLPRSRPQLGVRK
jgi:hypothetical protein